MLERPNTQYRIYRSLAVGDNQGGGIGAMTLPGTRIRGVIVDNPSGSWVQLDGVGLGFQPYVAPYTMAWSVSLLPSVNELSAKYVAGPIGQVSFLAGAPVVVYVFENQVPSSAGSTFLTPSTPDQTFWKVGGGIAKGVVSAGQIPTGSALKTVALSGTTATGGGAQGLMYVRITDGVSTPTVLLGTVVVAGVCPSPVLVYPEPFMPPTLSLAVPNWFIDMVFDDFWGVGAFQYFLTITYR
jgi:hypothetical protein